MLSSIDFKFYAKILWKRLPLLLIIVVAFAAAGIYYAFTLPAVYQARATILVESPKIPQELATSTVSVTSDEVIQVIKQRLMTRENLLRLGDKFDVFAALGDISASERVAFMRGAASIDVISLGGTTGATTFAVAFKSSDPNAAALVANEMVTIILDQNVALRTERATLTAEFFEEDVQRLSGELARIEGEIVAFKNENAGALPDSVEFRRDEISRIQARLVQLSDQEAILRDNANMLRRVLENPEVNTPLPDAVLTPDELLLQDLKTRLAQRGAILSQTHPEIVSLETQIASLEDRIRENRLNAIQSSSSEGEEGEEQIVIPSEIEATVQQYDANIASIAAQRTALEEQIATLTNSLRETPAVEMQLNILERQHETINQQYINAQDSLSAAATGEVIETSQQGERFELIEAAVVPEWPVSPNRKFLAAAGVAGGLGVAFGLLVLLELLNTSIRRPVELEERLGIRPFGTVPYIETRGEVMRSRLRQFGYIAVVLFGIPAAAYVVHYQVMPIDLLVEKVLTRVGLERFIL